MRIGRVRGARARTFTRARCIRTEFWSRAPRERSFIDCRHDRETDAGRAQLLLGPDLPGDALCVVRDAAVQYAGAKARARRWPTDDLRQTSGTLAGDRQLE